MNGWNGRAPLMNCGWDPQGLFKGARFKILIDIDANCVEIGQMLVKRGANASICH